MSRNKVFTVAFLFGFVGLVSGTLIAYIGEKQPTYYVGWSHVFTFLVYTALFVWIGYDLGKED